MARVSRRNLAIAAVALAAVVPYLRTIPDYFVQDDFGGMQLLAAKPWHTFPLWFTMPWMEFIWGYTPDEIRPFTALSYQITALPGASVPHGHHVLNVLLHGANALLVLAIARRAALMSLAASTIAALAFALLPLGAESVAWITGRVDSLPAFYYLLSFLSYVMWRRDPRGSNSWYIWSLVWLFQALLSKQNTITMVAAVAAYDWMVLRRPIRPTWAWIRPYVPFALMTAGFLGLRYLILGEVLRESQLSSQRFAEFGGILSRHLHRMVWWDMRGVDERVMWFGGIYAAAAAVALVRAGAELRNRTLRAASYFAIVWVALGLAPTVAAGYESPRHAYLAAAGWTILIGLGFDVLRQMPVGARASRRIAPRQRLDSRGDDGDGGDPRPVRRAAAPRNHGLAIALGGLGAGHQRARTRGPRRATRHAVHRRGPGRQLGMGRAVRRQTALCDDRPHRARDDRHAAPPALLPRRLVGQGDERRAGAMVGERRPDRRTPDLAERRDPQAQRQRRPAASRAGVKPPQRADRRQPGWRHPRHSAQARCRARAGCARRPL